MRGVNNPISDAVLYWPFAQRDKECTVIQQYRAKRTIVVGTQRNGQNGRQPQRHHGFEALLGNHLLQSAQGWPLLELENTEHKRKIATQRGACLFPKYRICPIHCMRSAATLTDVHSQWSATWCFLVPRRLSLKLRLARYRRESLTNAAEGKMRPKQLREHTRMYHKAIIEQNTASHTVFR